MTDAGRPRLPRTDNPATDFSIELLTALVAQGVRHVVVCPGSRSQAPALVDPEVFGDVQVMRKQSLRLQAVDAGVAIPSRPDARVHILHHTGHVQAERIVRCRAR